MRGRGLTQEYNQPQQTIVNPYFQGKAAVQNQDQQNERRRDANQDEQAAGLYRGAANQLNNYNTMNPKSVKFEDDVSPYRVNYSNTLRPEQRPAAGQFRRPGQTPGALPTTNIIGGSITDSPKNVYRNDLNDREDVRKDLKQLPVQSYQTPQVTSSKASNLKSYVDRQKNKSNMEYSQGHSKTLNESQLNSNPLLGSSNYEPRRKAFQSEYKDYIRKSLETSRERSLSKREAKYMEKIKEAEQRSPGYQEPNLYATKQRYKYSNINQSMTDLNAIMDQGQDQSYFQNQPRLQTQAYANLLNNKDSNPRDFSPGTGYILKTDPLQVLIDQELKKQEYARELQQQMQENQQRKFDMKQKRLMQEAKEEGLTYVPSPMTKAGANIVGEQGGQVITLRTGAIKSLYSKQNNLNDQSSQEIQINENHQAADVFKADLFGNYDANMQARERQKEEWKENLKQQMQEQESKKMESKMKKKYDEEQEDERIHRQVRELQDQFFREENDARPPQVRQSYAPKEASPIQSEAPKLSQQRQNSNDRPIINTGVHQSQQSPPKKMNSPPPPIVRLSNQHGQPIAIVSRNSLNQNASQDSLGLLNNDRTPPRSKHEYQLNSALNNYHTNSSHQLPPPLTFNNQKQIVLPQLQLTNNTAVKKEVDYAEIENNLLRRLKNEAHQQQAETQRAMDKLSAIQNEIFLKQKQSELTSTQFYNDMIGQSRLTMASMKYQPTYNINKDQTKSAYTPYTPISPLPFNKPIDATESNRGKSGLRGVETNYMPFPMPRMETKVNITDPPSFEKSNHMSANESEAIAIELDDIIKRFNNT